MKSYIVLEHPNVNKLVREVNELLSKGYTPVGGVGFYNSTGVLAISKYTQAMAIQEPVSVNKG